jgi:hypothetical protein
MEYLMSLNRIPVWAAVLMLSGATMAYGQATQVPAPGGTVPPVVTPAPQILPPPGPSPQSAGGPSGQNAVVPAPGGTVPPTATPPAQTQPPGPSPQGGTTGH